MKLRLSSDIKALRALATVAPRHRNFIEAEDVLEIANALEAVERLLALLKALPPEYTKHIDLSASSAALLQNPVQVRRLLEQLETVQRRLDEENQLQLLETCRNNRLHIERLSAWTRELDKHPLLESLLKIIFALLFASAKDTALKIQNEIL